MMNDTVCKRVKQESANKSNLELSSLSVNQTVSMFQYNTAENFCTKCFDQFIHNIRNIENQMLHFFKI
jgi:hypothetical protein